MPLKNFRSNDSLFLQRRFRVAVDRCQIQGRLVDGQCINWLCVWLRLYLRPYEWLTFQYHYPSIRICQNYGYCRASHEAAPRFHYCLCAAPLRRDCLLDTCEFITQRTISSRKTATQTNTSQHWGFSRWKFIKRFFFWVSGQRLHVKGFFSLFASTAREALTSIFMPSSQRSYSATRIFLQLAFRCPFLNLLLCFEHKFGQTLQAKTARSRNLKYP